MSFTQRRFRRDPGDPARCKASNETGTHIGHIWSATGQELATVTFTNEGAHRAGSSRRSPRRSPSRPVRPTWSRSISTATTSPPPKASRPASSNGGLNAAVGAGVYNPTSGAFPAAAYQNANYFRDARAVAQPTTSSHYLTVPQSMSVKRRARPRHRRTLWRPPVSNDRSTRRTKSAPAARSSGWTGLHPAHVQWPVEHGSGRLRPGEHQELHHPNRQNDQLTEGTETFRRRASESRSRPRAPRTVLVSIIDDDSPASIAMADAAVVLLRAQRQRQSRRRAAAAPIKLPRSASQQATAARGLGIGLHDPGQYGDLRREGDPDHHRPDHQRYDTGERRDLHRHLEQPDGRYLGAQGQTTVVILDTDNPDLGNLAGQTA